VQILVVFDSSCSPYDFDFDRGVTCTCGGSDDLLLGAIDDAAAAAAADNDDDDAGVAWIHGRSSVWSIAVVVGSWVASEATGTICKPNRWWRRWRTDLAYGRPKGRKRAAVTILKLIKNSTGID
jgi:hypothetical protein